MVCIPMVCIPMVCIPMVCIPMVYRFFPRIFLTNFTKFFDEFNDFFSILDDFFDEILGIFQQIFSINLLSFNHCSFRIEVPSILFFSTFGVSYPNNVWVFINSSLNKFLALFGLLSLDF